MPCHEDDGNVNVCFGQFGLEVETAQSRQSDVEHQTAEHVGKMALQQFGGRPEHFDLVPDGPEQASERLAQGFIVINNKDDRLFGSRG